MHRLPQKVKIKIRLSLQRKVSFKTCFKLQMANVWINCWLHERISFWSSSGLRGFSAILSFSLVSLVSFQKVIKNVSIQASSVSPCLTHWDVLCNGGLMLNDVFLYLTHSCYISVSDFSGINPSFSSLLVIAPCGCLSVWVCKHKTLLSF